MKIKKILTFIRNTGFVLFLGSLFVMVISCSDLSMQPDSYSPMENSQDKSLYATGEGDIVTKGAVKGIDDGNIRELSVEIQVVSQPSHNNFTRYISFRSPEGDWIRVPIAFSKTANLVYSGMASKTGLGIIHQINQTGNRWHWDDMYLENRGGSTELMIKRLKIQVNYAPANNFIMDIKIVDRSVYRLLGSGYKKLNLNYYTKRTREKMAGFPSSSDVDALPLCLKYAIWDLGKTGSDGSHGPIDQNNPKYNAGTSHLCSEFVSWYHHESGLTFNGTNGKVYDYRNWTSTFQAYDNFSDGGRLYGYDKNTREWRNVHPPFFSYTPKPGDYLIRMKDSTQNISEHSMMLLNWNSDDKIAKVINGPWPVTIRTLNIQKLASEKHHKYYIGKVK